MSKKATKAAHNIFYLARYEKQSTDTRLSSRESASEVLGIDRTRLARIELGEIVPYPEEVLSMSELYNKPELCNHYCALHCPIGKVNTPELNIRDFDRIVLQVLGSLKEAEVIRYNLIDIASDGVVDKSEQESLSKILANLEEIIKSSQALALWAKKHITR